MMKMLIMWSSLLMMKNNSKINKILIQNFLFLSYLPLMSMMNLCLTSWSNIYKYMGMDNTSFMLIILTLWISSLMMMSTNLNSMINMILILMIMLFMAFSSMNMFMFYLFFESSMIPTFLIIMNKGMNPERYTASMYMMIYMITSSLPLLIMIFYMMIYKTLMFYMLSMMNIKMSFIWFIMTISAFLIKTPLYGMHMWLPKAHVEAPVYGSMILAAILLKLGTYGMIRMIYIIPSMFKKFSNWIFSTSITGMIMISIMCITQVDLKMIVAYSSVVHMNMALCAMLTLSLSGMIGCLMSMISHGLCSSGLFFMVNMFYLNSNSRSIFINKGLFKINTYLNTLWFMMCMNNMGCPPSLNLISEMFMIFSIMMWNKILMPLILISSIISSSYSIYLFIMPHHNKQMSKNFNMFAPSKLINLMNIILHLMPLNLMTLNLTMFSI